MQEELRKHETTLLISGMADVAFGAWSLIKAVLYVFLNKKELMEQLPEDANGPIIYVVIAAAVLFVAAVDCALRLYVGFSARAEAKGKEKGRGYLIAAFVLIALLVVSLVTSVWNDSYTVSSDFHMPVSLLLDFTSLFALTETRLAAVRVRKLKKLTR